MIKAEELRKGNVLEYRNGYGADWEEVVLGAIDILDCENNEKSFNEFHRAIPITEEWLLKFGFECDDVFQGQAFEYRLNYAINKSFKIQSDLKIFVVMGFTDEIEKKFVHQFQNIFFALTHTELTWKKG